MDHFSLPKGKGHLRIPNLTTEDYTCGDGGFEGYPARMSWSPEHVAGQNSFGGKSPAEVEAFFQSWLFFGCAIEVLAISGIAAQPSNLLDADRQFISTQKLPLLIRQWRQKVMQINNKKSPVHIEWAMKTALILRKVSSFVDTYCLPYFTPCITAEIQKSRNIKSPLPERIWISVIALGHTLMGAMISYYDIRRTGNHWGASTMLRNRMLRKGWCPMDVERSLTDMGIDGHYYVSNMPNLEVNISHESCTKDECLARNIDEHTYKQKHVQRENDCSGMKEVDMTPMIKIIKDGKVPVFTWEPVAKKLKLNSSSFVKRGISDPAYIAISHVWSDGMGNPTGNSLLECQLQQIQEMVNSAAESGKLKGSPQNFWLDTLCVPVGESEELKDLRLLCIRKMASIYKGAAAVLVLSSTIRKVATTDHETERGLALYFANWNRRLWTFQEGMLADKILLQFSDKAINYDDVDFPGVSTSIASGHCVTFPKEASIGTMAEFVILRDILRDRLFEQMGPMYARLGPLAPAISAIQFRSTSKRSDETICLGTLLRLKIERLQKAKNDIREEYRLRGLGMIEIPDHEIAERRMEIFLSMLRVFPRDIIFNSHRRLAKEGFRWAPASLLGIPRRGFVRSVEGSPAILDKNGRGLSLTGQGIIIRVLTKGTISSKHSNGYLIVKIPRNDHESFQLRVDTTQLEDHSSGFSWSPGNCYAVILSESIIRDVQNLSKSKSLGSVPKNGPELEIWFETLFKRSEGSRFIADAVIGTIRHGHAEDCTKMNCIQFRHECLGSVTLLNPSSIIDSGNRSDSALDTEDEDSGDSESPGDSADSSECGGPDSEDFSMAEDFEGSENPEELDPEDSQEPSSIISTANKPSANVPGDIVDNSLTDPNIELDKMSDPDSRVGDHNVPVKSLDSITLKQDNQAFRTPVSGTLKGKNTKWFIL